MNVYSDLLHSALKYFKDTKVHICNLLIITGDFNIQDSLWDSSFLHHSFISYNLIIITDSFNLELSLPTNQVLTRYSNTVGEANLVIDLMFLCNGSSELNNHLIHLEWCLSSDHTPLTILIPIIKENINITKFFIAKNSEKETAFIDDIITFIKNLDISNLSDDKSLEDIINSFTFHIEYT